MNGKYLSKPNTRQFNYKGVGRIVSFYSLCLPFSHWIDISLHLTAERPKGWAESPGSVEGLTTLIRSHKREKNGELYRCWDMPGTPVASAVTAWIPPQPALPRGAGSLSDPPPPPIVRQRGEAIAACLSVRLSVSRQLGQQTCPPSCGCSGGCLGRGSPWDRFQGQGDEADRGPRGARGVWLCGEGLSADFSPVSLPAHGSVTPGLGCKG
ncbi:unnamed protein product [Lepidochelys kempii]